MTTSLTFASPALLWGLLALPLAGIAYVLAQRRQARYAVRFTNLELLATLVPRAPAWRRHLPPALALLALGAIVLSVARPHALIPVPKEQATVVMVMDTSGSMAAADVQPSRIAAAKQAGQTFLNVLPTSFKVSVVAFASTTRTLVRPTTDRAAVRAALDALHAEGGTAMGDGLQRGLEIAQSVDASTAPPEPTGTGAASGAGSRQGAERPSATPPATPADPASPGNGSRPLAAILLLSDGANTDGRTHPLDAARAAQRAGIPVYTIALGTPDGTLEVPGPTLGGRGGFARRIAVPPDERTLRQIAEITGGQFFAAPSAGDLRAVYRDIGSRIGFEYERQEVTFAFAAAGAALLATAGTLALAWSYRFP